MKNRLTRLCLVAAVLVSCVSLRERLAEEIVADATCAAPIVESAVRLISFATYGHALEDGTLLKSGGKWIVAGADPEALLVAHCFHDDAWTEYEKLPFSGLNLTTGHTADGAWLLGWSGMHASEPDTATVLGFWAVEP